MAVGSCGNKVIILAVVLTVVVYQCGLAAGMGCIRTYKELKTSLRLNGTRSGNIQKMMQAFYPPNEAFNHIVRIHYCVRNSTELDGNGYKDKTLNLLNEDLLHCNETYYKYHFEWLANTLPLLTDSDVLQANTFNFAMLNEKTLTLTVDPFCSDVEGLHLLETLTVWLKSYAKGDEEVHQAYCAFLSEDHSNASAEAYVALFVYTNGSSVTIMHQVIWRDARKFFIGLWLGVSSLTFALILHVGRCSKGTANTMNKVLWETTAVINRVLDIPNAILSVMNTASNKAANEDTKKTPREKSRINIIGTEKGSKSSKKRNLRANLITSNDSNNDCDNDSPNINKHTTELTLEDVSGDEILMNDLEEGMPPSKARATRRMTWQEQITVEIIGHEVDDVITTEKHHTFGNFAKEIRKFASVSVFFLIVFIIYGSIVYALRTRINSYDWFIHFPFPMWFGLILVVNLTAFVITEIVLAWRRHKNKVRSNKTIPKKLLTLFINFYITISATTLPLFIFFHLFWLLITCSMFTVRIASSALFYIPLGIAFYWFGSITSWMFKEWKKLVKNTMRSKASIYKKIIKAIPLILRSFVPYLFLPFWLLLLVTLHMFSSFMNKVVHLENQNLLVVFAVVFVIVGMTKKIANHCKPSIEHQDDDDDDGNGEDCDSGVNFDDGEAGHCDGKGYEAGDRCDDGDDRAIGTGCNRNGGITRCDAMDDIV